MLSGRFWAYVGEPHGHIGWATLATSMPFASINSNNPRTNPRNFGGNCSAFGVVEKLFFLSRPFWIFFKKKIFCFIPMKINQKLYARMDGTQFLLLRWFTAKNERGNDKIAWVYVMMIDWNFEKLFKAFFQFRLFYNFFWFQSHYTGEFRWFITWWTTPSSPLNHHTIVR